MIEINMRDKGLRISGHASAGEGGEYAKVCGAATMLACLYWAAVSAAAEEGEAMVQAYKVAPGDVDIAFEGEVPGLWVLRPGVTMLAREYPQYVKGVQA